MKIQPCRNGCKKLITVQLDEGKYKPFEVDQVGNVTELHNCPNSDYNKNKASGGGSFNSQQSSSNSNAKYADNKYMDTNNSSLVVTVQDIEFIKEQIRKMKTSYDNIEEQLTKINNFLNDNLKNIHEITKIAVSNQMKEATNKPHIEPYSSKEEEEADKINN